MRRLEAGRGRRLNGAAHSSISRKMKDLFKERVKQRIMFFRFVDGKGGREGGCTHRVGTNRAHSLPYIFMWISRHSSFNNSFHK